MGKTIKGYKGFNKDMTCRGFQYEVGKTYEFPIAKICKEGAHFVLNPLDALSYYGICDGEFCEVESPPNAETDTHEEDSKMSTTKIKIGARLGLSGFVSAAVKFMFEHCKFGDGAKSVQSGNWAQSAQSGNGAKSAQLGYGARSAQLGDGAQSAQSGYGAKSVQSGDWAKSVQSGGSALSAQSGDAALIEMTGKNSVGASIGKNSKIKGVVGCWITLAEYKPNGDILRVKSAMIDGKKIKENTWYTLKNGRFVVAK